MRYEEQYNFVKQIPIFCNLDAISKYTLAEKILIKEYEQGNIIINTNNKNNDSYFKYRSHSNFSRISSKILSNQNNNNNNTSNNNNNNNNEDSNISRTHSQFTYDLLFLIKNGNVSIEKQGKRIQTLSHGEYFGVSNILFDNLPSKKEKLSVIANDHVTLYEISKAGLIEALGFNYKETLLFSLFKTIIQNNKYFNLIFNEKSLLKIFKTFKLIRYNNHDDIYIEGKSKLRMIIIIDGNIKNQKTKTIIAKTGDIIGEHCFQNKHIVLCNGLIAFNSLITLESEINEVFSILNLDIESIQQLKKLKRLNQLKRISLFKYLQHDLIEKISETVSIEKYALNDVIIKENCKGDKCYFIMKGSVQVYEKGKFIRELEKGSFFGERALIDHNDIRTATVIAKSSKVVCFILSKSNFNLIFNNENSRKYIEHKISMHNSDMSLTQLYYIKQIGKGKYGNVFLVHNTKNTYALKVLPIKQV
jgi:signal-transduction protein with cAMP-binding, CBS, and nucleotidyltransferase domain